MKYQAPQIIASYTLTEVLASSETLMTGSTYFAGVGAGGGIFDIGPLQ